MNEMQVFNFNTNSVRVVVREGEPWFVAKDVAEVLGYSDTNQAIRMHCKSATTLFEPVDLTGTIASGRGGARSGIQLTIIPERDVYRLIMRSKLPGAERFEEWVVGEVLPSIRKHGAYLTPSKIEEVLSDPDTIIRLATTLKQEKEQRAIAEAERDKAVREKAWISEKREATAMGKLGSAMKKIYDLENKLGEGREWKSVRVIDWLLNYFWDTDAAGRAVGHALTKLSRERGYTIMRVDDPLYNKVNAYHVDVIREFKDILDRRPDYLYKYRHDVYGDHF